MIVVIGAGLSGLVAARELSRAGYLVTVLDKGRGPGGRMATRRRGEAVFDHGAQFFSARHPRFIAEVDRWTAAGAASTWHELLLRDDGGADPDGRPRHRGLPSMTAPAKQLAGELEVQTGARVVSIDEVDGSLGLTTSEGHLMVAEAVVATPPVPQTLELVADELMGAEHRARLERIDYEPCLALLVTLEQPSGLAWPGAMRPGGEPIEWVADNQVKGVSPVPALTVHLGPEASRGCWDLEPEEVWEQVREPLADLVGQLRAREIDLARWRYARPRTTLAERALVVHSSPPLVLAGDAFGGPLVEGAFHSGLAAAQRIVELLGSPVR